MPNQGVVDTFHRKEGYGFIALDDGRRAFMSVKDWRRAVAGDYGPTYGSRPPTKAYRRRNIKGARVCCELRPGTKGELPETWVWTLEDDWKTVDE